MDPENTGNAGSETSGEQPTPEVETTQVETPSEAPQDAGGAADEPKHDEAEGGSPCICKDGRPGTIHRIGGETICLANQG